MHPLSLRLALLLDLKLILQMKALGVLPDKVWIICEEKEPGIFCPRTDMPPCWDFDIAKSVERNITDVSGVRHYAIPFKMQAGGLLG